MIQEVNDTGVSKVIIANTEYYKVSLFLNTSFTCVSQENCFADECRQVLHQKAYSEASHMFTYITEKKKIQLGPFLQIVSFHKLYCMKCIYKTIDTIHRLRVGCVRYQCCNLYEFRRLACIHSL